LGEWALKQACADALSWPPNILLAVNLSPVQFSFLFSPAVPFKETSQLLRRLESPKGIVAGATVGMIMAAGDASGYAGDVGVTGQRSAAGA
jgi:EAL domain-containing protein (putative c-di-GMP-specific phosphodiesterase class I)